MKTTTFTELRNHAKIFFDLVEKKGEIIEIIRKGKSIAIISPIKTLSRWKKSNPRIVTGLSLSKTLLKEREESTY